MSARDHYNRIVEEVIQDLDRGNLTWIKKWAVQTPVNMISLKPYRGTNVFMLYWHMAKHGFQSNAYATFNQIKSLQGYVKKGAKACPIFYYQPMVKTEMKDGVEVKRSFPLMRCYYVFNLEQTSLVDLQSDKQVEPLKEAEKLISKYKDMPKITYGKPAYSPRSDVILMPKMSEFVTVEEYYSTLFHEMIHSTGHKDRLNRKGFKGVASFGSDEYSKEELIAEFGRLFLGSRIGMDVTENNKAYIQNWAKHLGADLKQDKTLLRTICSSAQKATDYITGERQ